MSEIIVESVEPPVPAALAAVVNGWTGYHQTGFAAGIHRGLPGPTFTLVLPIGDPLTLAWPGAATNDYDALLGGLHAGPVHIHHDGTQHGIEVDLNPLAARHLFGFPAAELTRAVVPLDELFGSTARQLSEQLAMAPTWTERFAYLEAGFARILADRDRDRVPSVPDEVRWASRRLVASGGQVTVAKLAADVGWSRRRLAERFRQEVGLPPKLFARVLRFERARLRLREPDRPALAEVAAESGYYDQAHLNRDFAELAGCSPTRWLADEAFPSVQDTPAPAGGG